MSQTKQDSRIEKIQKNIEIHNMSQLRIAHFDEETGEIQYQTPNNNHNDYQFLTYIPNNIYTDSPHIFGTDITCPVVESEEDITFDRAIFIVQSAKDKQKRDSQTLRSLSLRKSKKRLLSWIKDENNFKAMVAVSVLAMEGQNALEKQKEYEKEHQAELVREIDHLMQEIKEESKKLIKTKGNS